MHWEFKMSKHILKYTEWESASGWHCNDVSDLAGISGYWWVPARLLNMTPVDFIKWLIENYKPDHVSFNGKTLLYHWDKDHYSNMHAFVLYINKIARNKNFFI
jgi:hypothetical protein